MTRRLFNGNWYELWTCGKCAATLELPFDRAVYERSHNCEPEITIAGLTSAAYRVGIMLPGVAYEKELPT